MFYLFTQECTFRPVSRGNSESVVSRESSLLESTNFETGLRETLIG